MIKDLPFNEHAAEYDAWFDRHPHVFESELAAIKSIWPAGKKLMSLEIGCATGRFASALGIREGIEPAANLCAIAEERGVNTLPGMAEDLPYGELQFDVVLMNNCISYFENIPKALKEAYRVLKYKGCLIVGFVDKNSRIGKHYENRKEQSLFYRKANFFTVEEIEERIKAAGFNQISYVQTLFGDWNESNQFEQPLPGYGKGSFVLAKAVK